MGRLHRHNLDLIRECQRQEHRVGKAEGIHDQDIFPVEKFGFHTAHFFGPEFHVPANTWEKNWAVSYPPLDSLEWRFMDNPVQAIY